jgi:hypothetical protein
LAWQRRICVHSFIELTSTGMNKHCDRLTYISCSNFLLRYSCFCSSSTWLVLPAWMCLRCSCTVSEIESTFRVTNESFPCLETLIHPHDIALLNPTLKFGKPFCNEINST